MVEKTTVPNLGESFRQKPGVYTETVARTFPGIHKTRTKLDITPLRKEVDVKNDGPAKNKQ